MADWTTTSPCEDSKVLFLERGEIASGTSGRSWIASQRRKRYWRDRSSNQLWSVSRRICNIEVKFVDNVLSRTAGYFVALNDEDVEYGNALKRALQLAE